MADSEQQSNSPISLISSEEIEQPICSQSSDENSDSGDSITVCQDSRYPFVLHLLQAKNLVPGTGKIREQNLNKYNIEMKMMARRMIQITNDLTENYDKRDPKEENEKKYVMLPLQDSENYDASPPRKQRKLEGICPRIDPHLIRLSEDVETQIAFVNGMIEYHNRNGVDPLENDAALEDFITIVLELNIRPADLRKEIERLWGWCLMNLGHLESLTEREIELIGLIRIIWYGVSQEGRALNFGSMTMNNVEVPPSNNEEKREVSFRGDEEAGKSSSEDNKDSGDDDVSKASSLGDGEEGDGSEAEEQEESFQGHDVAGQLNSLEKSPGKDDGTKDEKQESLQGHEDKKDGDDVCKASSSASAGKNDDGLGKDDSGDESIHRI